MIGLAQFAGALLLLVGVAATGLVAVVVATRAPSLPLDPSVEDARRAIRECWAQGCYADDAVSIRRDTQGRWWLLDPVDAVETLLEPDEVERILTRRYRWARAVAQLLAGGGR